MILSPELRALIQQLELTTRKLVTGPLLGDWRSGTKGSGFEFHQLRDYEPSDDIRFIDWKASARADKMLVKEYLDDRTKIVHVVLDVSASTTFSSKADLMKQLAACLAFVGLHSKDAVGLLLFSKEVEVIIPPRQSRAHVWSLVEKLFMYEARHKTTDFRPILEYLARLKTRRSTVCLITDCLAPLDKRLLQAVARYHDVRIFRCLDERERAFPQVGSVRMEDRETGKELEIAGNISKKLLQWNRQQKELCVSSKVPLLDLTAGEPFTGDLVRFLRQRVGV